MGGQRRRIQKNSNYSQNTWYRAHRSNQPMNHERDNLCLKINRRSSLAIVVIFVFTNSTELLLLLGGIGLAIAPCGFVPNHTAHLERQIDSLREISEELHRSIAFAQEELENIRNARNCREWRLGDCNLRA